jgi:GDP-L-fucose synthase
VASEPIYTLAGKRVWVAGHRGMVGAALVRRLEREDCEIVTVDRGALDLRRQADVEAWMADAKPQAVFLAAARVGGILANDSYPAEFLHDNLAIETNLIEAARRVGTEKLLFLGSSCIYPKEAPQPIDEAALLTGPLEPTNEWYAIAKIAGLKLAQAYRRQYGCDFISAMPTNLYGPNDNFDLASSHVLPALMRKAHEAKRNGNPSMTIWGSGAPRREFMHVDDCADALVFLMRHYSGDGHINVGVGEDVTIAGLAGLVCEVVGYGGRIVRDETKPDGTPRKLMSSARLQALGWRASIPLHQGLAQTYSWFLAQPIATASSN